jgi:hypothetical protein
VHCCSVCCSGALLLLGFKFSLYDMLCSGALKLIGDIAMFSNDMLCCNDQFVIEFV